MTDNILRKQAEDLRRRGLLYTQIAHELQVPKSTVHGWLRNLGLTPSEQVAIKASLAQSKAQAVVSMIAARRNSIAADERALAAEAANVVANASLDKNTQKIICAVMFWCEGQKDVGSGIKFINSDPVMMRSFITLLRESFIVDESKFRALLHLHDYHDEQKQLTFWSEVTGIPLSQFYKSYRKPHTGRNTRDGYPGCLSLRYGDVRLGKLLKMIYSSLGNNLGV